MNIMKIMKPLDTLKIMPFRKRKPKNIVNLEQERAEKLAEIGAFLRQTREQQRRSLEEMAARTMIRWRQLYALEEGKIQYLPEPVYIKGFILRYAEALGLDGNEIASEFPLEKSQPRIFKTAWLYLPIAQLRPIHLYAMYIVVIICSVKGLSYLLDRSTLELRATESLSEPAVQPVVETQKPAGQPTKPVAVNATVANPGSQSVPGQPDKPVRVGVIVKDESWVQIQVDGQIEFEGTLTQGTERTWVANQQLVVITGNAGGLLIAVNDGQAKQLGAPSEVKEVTFTANSDKENSDS